MHATMFSLLSNGADLTCFQEGLSVRSTRLASTLLVDSNLNSGHPATSTTVTPFSCGNHAYYLTAIISEKTLK